MKFRHIALGLGAFVAGSVALTAAAVAFVVRRGDDDDAAPQPLVTAAADGPAPSHAQVRDETAPTGDGHAAPDLAADAAPVERAPAAFRPDIDAPMTAAEREALRPAAGPSPTLVDAGTSLPSGN